VHPKPARRRRALVVLLAALLGPALGLAVAQPASAHDRLVSSDPKDGARLDDAPSSITLVFSAEVLEAGAQVAVTTPDGTVPTEVSVDGDEATAALPADLPGGAWEVSWRVVSSDGHPIEGELAYTVADAAPSPSPTTATPTPTSDPTPSEAAPSPSPSAATTGHEHGGGTPGVDLGADGEAGWATAWLFPVAVLAAVGVAAAVVLRVRRRDADDPDDADDADDADDSDGPHDAAGPTGPAGPGA